MADPRVDLRELTELSNEALAERLSRSSGPPRPSAEVFDRFADPFADLFADLSFDDEDEDDPLRSQPLPMTVSEGSLAGLAPQQVDERLLRLGVETDSRRRLNTMLPWIVSIIGHLAILAVALAITWVVVELQETPESVLIVSDFRAPTYRPVTPGGSNALASAPSASAPATLPVPMTPDPAAPSLTAPAAKTPGVDWGPATGRAVVFAGVRASNARRIVYVVDASGSMIGTLPIVLEEVTRSLKALAPDQSFSLLFFQRNESIGAPPADRLIPAVPATIERSLRWASQRIIPAGRSNPIKALETALRMRPDVIFLLGTSITGSGEFEIASDELLARLDGLNPADASGRRRARIQCVQFLDPDPLDILRRIAEAHGGPDGYRFLSRAELNVAPKERR